MNLIFTIVAALPLGFFIARRQHAILTYLITGSFVFSLQSVALLLTWMSGGEGLGGSSGFGDSPTGAFPIHYSNGEVVAYGVVNAIITTAGVGLVMLCAKLRARRQAHSPGAVIDVAR